MTKKYYPGVRFQVMAFYREGATRKRKTEMFGTGKAAHAAKDRHLAAGASVEISKCVWREERTPLAWYDAPKRLSLNRGWQSVRRGHENLGMVRRRIKGFGDDQRWWACTTRGIERGFPTREEAEAWLSKQV
jgi:hypothetical protein